MDLPTPTDHNNALAQPTRARLFALLVELKRPTDTAELSARLGLHPNGIRRHLELMGEAGLVERQRAPEGRGRPPDRWRVAAGARPGGERPRAYSDLASWLARAIPDGPRRSREVEQAGREIGAELAPQDVTDPVEGFRQVITALGFQPEIEVEADGELLCRLENCPYRDAVRAGGDIICTLHRGITAGLLGELDAKAELDRFEPRDPDQAGCIVQVSGGSWPKPAPAPSKRD